MQCAGLALDAVAPLHCDDHSANAASMLMELKSLGCFADLDKFIQAPSVVIHFLNCCYMEYQWINRPARLALIRSERFCRPCFRLAIGSALVVYVRPVFALRLGRL
jgi:hypothetical protein